MTPDEIAVLALLAKHTPAHLSQPDIAYMTGVPLRRVQEAIRSLVLAGHAVCSDDAGHWLAQRAAEAYEDAERLEGRIRAQAERVRAQKANADRMAARENGTLWEVA